MTKQKQHKNIRITKEKNMYKIIKNNTSMMASYESKKEAYNAILIIQMKMIKILTVAGMKNVGMTRI